LSQFVLCAREGRRTNCANSCFPGYQRVRFIIARKGYEMKKIVLFAMLVLITVFCYSQDITLSYEYFYSSKWAPADGSWGYWIEFRSDKTFHIYYVGEGGGQDIDGAYLISDDKVILSITNVSSEEYLPKELLINPSVWTMQKDNESLFFTDKITNTIGYTFWRSESEIPVESIRQVEGNTLIRIMTKKCLLISNSRVRKGPNTSYQYFDYEIEGYGKISYLPNGWEIEILGRSEEMQTIDGKTDYWYYCDTNIGWYNAGPSYGWIFGALIKK